MVVSTRIVLRASPLGFSLKDITRPVLSIFIKPRSDARRSSTGTTESVMSALVSRWR